MQEQAQQMQMEQMRQAQEQAAKRQAAMGQLEQQHPQLAPLFQVAPDKAIDRAFPAQKMQFAPNGQAVDMNAVQPGQNFAAPDKPRTPEIGKIREIISGGKTLQYEWTGSGWEKVGEGPRFKADKPEGPEKPPAGYRWNPQGGLEFIPGGPADMQRPGSKTQEHPTEDERRSAGLTVRLESALKTIQGNPDAGKPEVVPSAIRAMTMGHAEALPNVMTSTPRQKVESAQLDALDAALTLATGAAYTKDQLQNLRKSYFPQLGDSKDTIKEKEHRFSQVIETARIRAGRAAGTIDPVLKKDPVDDLLKKYAPK
jgi:hypothetical protein